MNHCMYIVNVIYFKKKSSIMFYLAILIYILRYIQIRLVIVEIIHLQVDNTYITNIEPKLIRHATLEITEFTTT